MNKCPIFRKILERRLSKLKKNLINVTLLRHLFPWREVHYLKTVDNDIYVNIVIVVVVFMEHVQNLDFIFFQTSSKRCYSSNPSKPKMFPTVN